LTRKRQDGRRDNVNQDGEISGSNRNPYDSFLGGSESDDRHRLDSLKQELPGEGLRTKIGLTDRQWTWVVSLLMFLPYPVFVYFGVIYDINTTLFISLTLAFSLVLIIVSFYL